MILVARHIQEKCQERDRLSCGVEIDYSLDERLCNLSRHKVKTKVTKTAVADLHYADDGAVLAHAAEELQTSLDLLTEAYRSLLLSINIRKPRSYTN